MLVLYIYMLFFIYLFIKLPLFKNVSQAQGDKYTTVMSPEAKRQQKVMGTFNSSSAQAKYGNG